MKKYFFIALSYALPLIAFAQEGGAGNVGEVGGSNRINFTFTNPFSVGDDLYSVLEGIVNNVVLPIGGVLVVLAFIYAGFMYVMARGNTTKIADANRMLLYAAIGTAVLLGSWIIANVIRNTVNELIT